MNRLLLVFLTLAAVLALVPEGLAVPTNGLRHHKKHALKNRRAEDAHSLTARYVGKVKRQTCRAPPSVTQSVPSSSAEPSPSALVVGTGAGFSAPLLNPITTSTSEAPQAPSSALTTSSEEPASTTTSEEPAPTTSVEPAPTTSEEPSPTTNEASSTAQSSSSTDTSSSDIDEYLSDHNTVRAQHGAAALTWNDTLASAAQSWANGCVFEHSGGTLGPYGENLAAGTGDSYGIDQAIQSWTNEVSSYDPNDPQPSHFTQVVWKATQQLGCAVQNCNGIFPAEYGVAHYYVCEYYPQGNVLGEFSENVQA
ncbi:CAP domain-containing protein [Fomitopsis betulina]|nr:CAP domain-containing protein [Fomitopsis betulina]